MVIAQSVFVVKWFAKTESTVPFGLTVTGARLGSILTFAIAPRIISTEVRKLNKIKD